MAAAVLALVLTPLVRRVVVRYEIVDRPDDAPGQHVARAARRRPRHLGGVPWSRRACSCSSTSEPIVPSRSRGAPRWPRSCSVGRSRPRLGAIDDLFDLRARWQLLGQIGLAVLAVALGISIDFIANPFGPGVIRVRRAASRPASRSSGSSA